MSGFAIPWAVETAPDPRSEYEDLLAGPASQTTRLGPPWQVPPRPVAAPEELDTDDEQPADPDVPRLAGAPLPDAQTPSDDDAFLPVQEAAAWKSEDHPRWPKGTPERGGEFIRVGEHFMSGGKEWEVAHIVHGRIYAHEASGKYKQTETRSFDVAKGPEGAHVPDAEYKPPTSVPKGGKHQSTVTVVDPYVDSATHDPSIPIPEASQLTPEQWQRFGKLDQEHYTELMERFGPHKPGAAKAHVDKAYAAFHHAEVDLVKQAYLAQYGTSSGYSLSLASGSGGHPDTPDMAKLRQEAKALQAEHKAAVQWDLYNRTHSPDVFAVHKSKNWSSQQWHDYAIAGDNPAFSGLSQSYAYRRNFFGSPGIATPLAIRHVLLSSNSAQPIPGKSLYASELEISVPDQLKLDGRSFAFTSSHGLNQLSASQLSWLEGVTNEPVGGQILEQLRDSVQNGTYLPPPPKPASIVMDGANGKTWVDPTPDMAKAPFDVSKLPTDFGQTVEPGELPKDLPWLHKGEDGLPQPQTGETAGAKSGQYFMGMKGTLYWIGPDPGNTGGYPFRIHKIVGGEFNGENFAFNPDLPGYYLDAHQELPKVDEELPDFNPAAWVKSTESKFLDQFAAGEKFKLNGASYEVTGQGVGGQVKIRDLESGLTGQVNGDYKSAFLVPYGAEGADPEDMLKQKPLAEGDLVRSAFGLAQVDAVDDMPGPAGGQIVHVTHIGSDYQMEFPASELYPWPHQTAPAVGVTFEHDGKKAVITKVRKDGTIQANLKPGQLLIEPQQWHGVYAAHAFDPGAHQISDLKVKLRDMKVGDRFQGGAGNQTMRPYEVVFKDDAAKTVRVRNLDTAEVSELSKHQSYRPLVQKADDAPTTSADKTTPQEVTGAQHVGPAWDPSKFDLSGEKANLLAMPVGTYFQDSGGQVAQKVGEDDTYIHVAHSADNWEPSALSKDSFANASPLPMYQAKGASSVDEPPAVPEVPASGFDPSSYVEGDQAKIGHLPGGTIFKTNSKQGPKYYQLSDDGTKSTNLLTGKVYEAKPHFKATPLQPVGGEGKVTLGSLNPGDAFSWPSGEEGTVVKHEGGKTYAKAAGSVGPDAAGVPFEPSELVQGPSSSGRQTMKVGDLPPGAIIHLKDGGPVQIASTAAQVSAPFGMVQVKAPGSGDIKGTPIPANLPGYVVEHADAAPPSGPQPQMVGNLTWQKGDKFVSQGNAQVTNGAILTAVDDKPKPGGGGQFTTGDGQQHTVFNGHHLVPLSEAEHPEQVSHVGTNKQNKTFGDLKPGAIFSPAHGGIQYEKTGDTFAKAVTGPQVGLSQDFHPEYVPDDLHHEPLTLAHVGQKVTVNDPGDPLHPSLGGAVHKTGYVAKVRASDGAIRLAGATIKWHKPEHVTVHDEHLPSVHGGDQVMIEPGGDFGGAHGTFMGWNDQGQALVDVAGDMNPVAVEPESIASVAPGTGEEQTVVPLTSKMESPPPLDQLALGDAVQLGWLKPGDQMYVGPSHLVQVTGDPYQDGHETHVPIADVASGGHLAAKWALPDGFTGTLHSHAKDVVPAELPPKVEAQDLPDAVVAGGLVPYQHPKGGVYVYAQIGQMPEGAVFQDKGNHLWKVKQAGAAPIISDGEQHYAVSPSLRGKDLSQPGAVMAGFTDSAGPIGNAGSEPVHVQAAEADLVPNQNGLTMGALHWKPGDYLQPSWAVGGESAPWTYEAPPTPISGHKIQNVKTGAVQFVGDGHVPTKYSPGAVIEPAVGGTPDVEGAPAPSLFTEATTAGDLAHGDKILVGPGSGTVHTVDSVNPDGSLSTWDPSGDASYLPSGTTVYKQPDDAPSAAAVKLNTPPPPADPAVDEPLVHGPDDFDQSAAPELDPNWSTMDQLDAFQHPKGGIYKYPQIHTLQEGQKFTDKSGKDYRVVMHGSGVTVYEDIAGGQQFGTPGTSRVKLTALPPDPGPSLKPVVNDLVHKYGDLENVPEADAIGYPGTSGMGGKQKYKLVSHMKYGQAFEDAVGHPFIALAAWADRALVLDGQTNEPVLLDGALRFLPT